MSQSQDGSGGCSSSEDDRDEDEYVETDIVSKLPEELAVLIFSFLEAEELFVVACVSKTWRHLVNNDILWKKICFRQDLHDENFPYEFGLTGAPRPSGWCRWAHVYRTALYRQRKWEHEETIHLCPSKVANCFGVHGTTMAVGNCGGNLTVHCNVGQDVITVQTVELNVAIRDVRVALNTIVILVGDWAAVLRLANKQFETEAVFHPELEHFHDELSDLEKNSNGEDENKQRGTKTLLVTRDFVWFKTTSLKIYCRSSRTFSRYEIKNITDVKHNHRWVAILCPGSINIFRHNGSMVFSVFDESFYTGLVMSSIGVAFLESPDFDDPVAAYVDLSTHKKTVIDAKITSKLKVYKLALYCDTVFCLNGRERFDLSCHKSTGEIQWIVPLQGSKYLRPGKDFFQVICSKFIFLSPAQVRLDVFDLYDKDNGAKLYTVSINTSSYNICDVTNTGITIQSNSSRSYRYSRGSYISWISLA